MPRPSATGGGPTGFRTTTERLDFRVGGDWLHTMHGPDGTDYPNYSVYRVIEPNARIVYDHATAPGEPFLFRAEIRLTALGPTRTRILLETRFNDIATRDLIALQFGAVEGGRQHLMRLDGYLTGARRLTHRLDGRDLVLVARCRRGAGAGVRGLDRGRPDGALVGAARVRRARNGVRAACRRALPHRRARAPDGAAYPMDGRYVAVEPDRSVVVACGVAEHPASWHALMTAAIRAAGGEADAVVGPMEMRVVFTGIEGGTRVDVVPAHGQSGRGARLCGRRARRSAGGMSFERLDALLLG